MSSYTRDQEGLRLLMAFRQIEDSAARHIIVALAEAIARGGVVKLKASDLLDAETIEKLRLN